MQSLILIRKYSIKISARFHAAIFLNIEDLRQRIFSLSRGLLILKKIYGKNMKNFLRNMASLIIAVAMNMAALIIAVAMVALIIVVAMVALFITVVWMNKMGLN